MEDCNPIARTLSKVLNVETFEILLENPAIEASASTGTIE